MAKSIPILPPQPGKKMMESVFAILTRFLMASREFTACCPSGWPFGIPLSLSHCRWSLETVASCYSSFTLLIIAVTNQKVTRGSLLWLRPMGNYNVQLAKGGSLACACRLDRPPPRDSTLVRRGGAVVSVMLTILIVFFKAQCHGGDALTYTTKRW